MTTHLINAADLYTHLGSFIIFDVRHQLSDSEWGRRAYAQGHIEGSHYLHMDQDLSGRPNGHNGRHPLPDAREFVRTMGRCGGHRGARVVVYDQNNGTMAARLWWMLKHWLDHAEVTVLDGGWEAWLTADLPQQTVAPIVPTQVYDAQMQPHSMVDATWVLTHLNDAHFQLVDARATDRFEGRVEPMDPVAGHIPGALNRPCSLNVEPNGIFKSPAKLRQEWLDFLAGPHATEVVHQCGSGVTACHNLLAMEIAGLSGSRVYPGSWSEWCSDPTRPMVTKT